jgi:hypothetical protein
MNSPDVAPDTLTQSLRQLHVELSSARHLDEDSRELLRAVLADIERLLKDGAAPGAGAAPHRLEAVAVDFEAEHPDLAASVRQFIDLLGKVGL